jgi:hypothetical protein
LRMGAFLGPSTAISPSRRLLEPAATGGRRRRIELWSATPLAPLEAGVAAQLAPV